VVCSGNICRSPTAEVVLTARVAEAGLGDRVVVDSSGLGGWHVGDRMHPRSAAFLTAAGYDADRHRAQQIARDWPGRYDLVLAMDRGHLHDLRSQARRAGADDDARSRIRLFGDFDPVQPGSQVPDPYYGGDDGFEEVLTMVERTAAALVATLQRELGAR
jgi:protein-tyrosine phosphatase